MRLGSVASSALLRGGSSAIRSLIPDATSTPRRAGFGAWNGAVDAGPNPDKLSVYRGLRSIVVERRGARSTLGSQCSTN